MLRHWRVIAVAYSVALAASHVVRALHPVPAGDGTRPHTIVMNEPGRPEAMTLAYDDVGSGAAGRLPVVVIHGSPGGRTDVETFGTALASHRRRVLLPDLPGSGASSHRVPDYGFRAQAGRVEAWLDAVGARRVHLVGFSMGGGVVLTLANEQPARVASMSLISALGVQEMELFGNYQVNHAVHGLQLAAIWTLQEGVPHFGWLDGMMLSVPYARTFYDSDQRPLRKALATLDVPTLIVHGRRDPLVPIEAAREHARLVPQSELVVLDTDHFFIGREPSRAASIVDDFVDRVEAGLATSRVQAQPSRVRAAALPFDPGTVPPFGPVAALVLLLSLACATLISEDLTCIAAGMLIAHERIGFVPATVACFAGIFAGDLALFLAGRFIGKPIVTRWPLSRLIGPERLERSGQWLTERGAGVIVISRFVPGMRLPTYVAAGVLGLRTWTYVRTFAVAALIWTPLLVGVSTLATRWSINLRPRDGVLGASVIGLLVVGTVRLATALATREGRRRAVGTWRRVTCWEFWPLWVLYLPVVGWIAWLALRYRSLTVFTAANPGMPAGGIVGESKRLILGGLVSGRAPVAPFLPLLTGDDAGARAVAASRAVASWGLPLVFKPDQGQRGSGVSILRAQEDVDRIARTLTADAVLQKYVGGLEFGVFYARRPDEPRGRIISLTRKRLPTVRGDGRRTLRDLILDDERAVALADTYLAINRERLHDVPEVGAAVIIGELGSHCRGAVFENGESLVTPALEEAIEAASRALPGFTFGRFDVRAESDGALTDGRFTILELNGVTSEPTHIYDPASSVWQAWRTLAATWSLAFAIGDAQRRRGVPVASMAEILQLCVSYRRFIRRRSVTAAASASSKPSTVRAAQIHSRHEPLHTTEG